MAPWDRETTSRSDKTQQKEERALGIFSRVREALQLDESAQTQGSVVRAEEILQENTSLPLEIPSGPINSNLSGAVVTELC